MILTLASSKDPTPYCDMCVNAPLRAPYRIALKGRRTPVQEPRGGRWHPGHRGHLHTAFVITIGRIQLNITRIRLWKAARTPPSATSRQIIICLSPCSGKVRAQNRAPSQFHVMHDDPNALFTARHEAPGILADMAKMAFPTPSANYSALTASVLRTNQSF